MLAAADWLLVHRPFVAEMGEHLGENAQFGIERHGDKHREDTVIYLSRWGV